MTRPLGVESLTAMVLRRVRRGGVARFEGGLFYRGRPMPPGLFAELLEHLVQDGLLQVHPADQHALQRISLTETGRARYQALCRPQPTGQRPPAEPGDGEPGAGERRGWCVAACGCSVEVPASGAVYVDCAACEPPSAEWSTGERRPGPGPEAGR